MSNLTGSQDFELDLSLLFSSIVCFPAPKKLYLAKISFVVYGTRCWILLKSEDLFEVYFNFVEIQTWYQVWILLES